MIHCPICGNEARAMTTEQRPDPADKKTMLKVYVYHHQIKQCREWEMADRLRARPTEARGQG